MQSSKGPWYWVFCVAATLGIYFGISVFFIFTLYYQNVQAGIWALTSATFASICLHLKMLSSNSRRLYALWSSLSFTVLAAVSFLFSCAALGLTLWYLIYAIYHRTALLPVRDSYYLTAVWSAMTIKWAFTTFLLSYKYSRILRYNLPFSAMTQEENIYEQEQEA